MDKNTTLALLLSVVVLFGWSAFMQKRYGKTPAQKPAAAAAQAAGAAGTSAAGQPAPASSISPTPAAAPSAEIGGLDGALSFGFHDLEIKIQPRGASIVSMRYPGPLGHVELVDRPFPGFFASFPELAFTPAGSDKNWPAFEARHPSGLKIRKEFFFHHQASINAIRIKVSNDGSTALELPSWDLTIGPGMSTVPSELKENAQNLKAVALVAPKKEGARDQFLEFDPAEEAEKGEGTWRWLGVMNRYFLAAAFPPAERFTGYRHGAWAKSVPSTSWFGGKKTAKVLNPWIVAEAAPLKLAPGESVEIEIPFYFGPKGHTHLSTMGRGLERSVSFGWFNQVGRFTLKVLEFFHGWTANWGWAIILLTICLQAVMFPLTYKSMKSMALMKKIQPEQTKLQQKFAKDPQRMNQELMALYKKRGVNPLGGCLPMLAQMPIFVALFNMLRNAWELHGAPWIFWVKDLSAQDPFYILPVVMGGVMFFQNKMQPAAGDPAQAKMMQYLPIIFTFMFLNFPAGLVLYWLTNSLLSFGQQLVIRKRMGD